MLPGMKAGIDKNRVISSFPPKYLALFIYRLFALPAVVLLLSWRGRDVLGGLLFSRPGREAVRVGDDEAELCWCLVFDVVRNFHW